MADNRSSEQETVQVVYRACTPNAVCVGETEDSDDVWLPLSMCRLDRLVGELDRGDLVGLTAPEWLLMDRGLI